MLGIKEYRLRQIPTAQDSNPMKGASRVKESRSSCQHSRHSYFGCSAFSSRQEVLFLGQQANLRSNRVPNNAGFRQCIVETRTTTRNEDFVAGN